MFHRWMLALALLIAMTACGRGETEREEGHGAKAGEAHEGEPGAPGRTRIAAAIAQSSGIRVAAVAAGVIANEHEVQGVLTPVEGRMATVMARFPGPIRVLRANVGDHVHAGQPLAVIESNLSLSDYTVPAPLSGVVLARNAAVGAVATEGMALFEIADLSDLRVDLNVFGSDVQLIAPGVPVTVTRMSDGVSIETTIERMLPNTAMASQSTVARATIHNRDGLWRPGSAVQARVTVDKHPADMVVPLTALQTADNADVVYVRQGETYLTRPVKLGRRDARQVEILSGLKPGEQVVVEQSFLIKADIEKSSAEEED